MNECPFHKNKVRADLPPLIPRIAALPVDERGYPVPFFVAWVGGKPEFRLADAAKRAACLASKLCWVCGQTLGRYKAFTIGPMCVVNRTTFEPPAHHDCAVWSAKGCPFLAKPQMVRRRGEGDDVMERNKDNVAGTMIDRNPGVTCVWITDTFKQFDDGRGGRLIEIGEPISLTWWREGRAATREEVLESISTGLPALEKVCADEQERKDLQTQVKRAVKLLPL